MVIDLGSLPDPWVVITVFEFKIMDFELHARQQPLLGKLRLSLVGRVGEDRDLDIGSRVVDAENPEGSGSVQPGGNISTILCRQFVSTAAVCCEWAVYHGLAFLQASGGVNAKSLSG